MNGPPPNGNENTIDIFVLSTSETLAPMLREHLEQNGYHVTLFNDDEQLQKSLKSGKPNLLICDTTNQELPSYDLCRQIKADRDLWNIPVLILTRVAELSDLLFVLDSNADNFISFPYDLPYLISLIGGMLDTPVERPTPEQIKTQFKIQHNDHIFVITADRRKLLEFLLSSFEIAITKHEDLSRAEESIRLLEESVDRLRSEAAENKRMLLVLNEKLEGKEQDLSALRAENQKKDHLITGKTREIETHRKEIETTSSILSDTRANLNSLTEETSAAAASYLAEIAALNEKITARAEEADRLGREISETRSSLQQVSEHCSDAEKTISDLREQKDQAENSLATRTREWNEAKEAYEKEKARVLAAGAEIKTVLASKTELEAASGRAIGDLESALKQQRSETEKYTGMLDEAESRCKNLEDQIALLKDEKERALAAERETGDLLASKAEREAELTRTVQHLQDAITVRESEIAKKESLLAEAEARCADREVRIVSLENEAGHTKAESRKRIDDLQKQLADIEIQYNAAAGKIEEMDAALKSRDRDFAEVSLERDREREKVRLLTAEKEETRTALTEEKLNREAREDEIAGILGEKDRISDQARSLSRTLEEVQLSLAAEKEERRISEEKLGSVIQKQAAEIESLQGAHKDVKTDRDLHHSDLVQTRRDLDIALKGRADLESAVTAAREKIQLLEKELRSVSSGHTQAGQQVRALGDELEQTKAALETERRLRHVAEESLHSAIAAHERSGQDIGRLMSERGSLNAAIEAERRSREEAERGRESARKEIVLAREKLEEAKKQQAIRADQQDRQIRTLSGEIESARDRQKTLEEQILSLRGEKDAAEKMVASLSAEIEQARMALADEWEDHMNEKEAAEKTASTLTTEIEQARSALADEWEDHMTVHEQLAVATEEKEQLKNQAIIVKGPDLPVMIKPSPLPAIVPPSPEPDHLVITGVEDLFEDPEPEEKREESVQESSFPAGPDEAVAGDILSGPDAPAPYMGEEETDDTSSGYEQGFDQDETGEDYGEPDERPSRAQESGTNPGVSFNRAQWFDLLRWSHHSGALTQEQRMQIVRMGRLIQRGRKLTAKQEEQVVDMITLAQALGYRFRK
jgi:DNA-binding response OmpR family regulator/chromosome segregation ATPase